LPICGAASGLHTSTIVHRDIKPANLLVFSLSSSETVVRRRQADRRELRRSLSRQFNDSASGARLKRRKTSSIVGKVAAMSPSTTRSEPS
jgi:serine/threonine protein kinase